MLEIPISEVKLGDVRKRAIVSVAGQHIEGVIERVSTWGRLDRKPKEDWYEIYLKVGKGEVKTGHVPGDFLIQIDR